MAIVNAALLIKVIKLIIYLDWSILLTLEDKK